MTISNRTVSLTGVFAKDALTTIPSSPVSGVSYRNEDITKAIVEGGWPYKEIVDSAAFNQVIYEYATLTSLIEKYGFLPWSSLTDYEQGSLCLGTDGVIYQAKQATGPSSTAYDPVNDTSHTYWEDFVGSNYVTLSTTQTITGEKKFSNSNAVIATGTVLGTAPSSNRVISVPFQDNNGVKVAGLEYHARANGVSLVCIMARKQDGSNNHQYIRVGYDENQNGIVEGSKEVRDAIIEWVMPGSSKVETSFMSTNTGTYTYTAPGDGWFTCGFVCSAYGGVVALYINNVSYDKAGSEGHNHSLQCPCKKGDKVKIEILEHNLYTISWQRFIYAKGN